MPNWCRNSITIHHNDLEMLNKFVAASNDGCIAKTFCPEPNPSGDIMTPEQYDWRIENWGTKWDFGVEDLQNEDMNTVYGYIDTAWTPPVGVYHALKALGFRIDAIWIGDGDEFAGRFKDGKVYALKALGFRIDAIWLGDGDEFAGRFKDGKVSEYHDIDLDYLDEIDPAIVEAFGLDERERFDDEEEGDDVEGSETD
jgi:hypothetical protein